MLGQSLGVPLFLGNLEVCVQLTAEQLGWDAFRPGDIFYMNDSYLTGTHLNDATIFGAVFWRDRLVGFTATRAHWLDVGAKDPGGSMDSRETYQEGVRLGPTRLFDRGEPREDIIDLLRRNSRFGYSLVGDLNAQVAACRTGEARFQAILDRFGYEAYAAARRGDLPAVGGARAGGGGGDRRRHLRRRGVPRRRRARPRAGPRPRAGRRRGRPDDDRPRGLVAADRGAGELRARPGGLRLPRRLQAARSIPSGRSTAAPSRRSR